MCVYLCPLGGVKLWQRRVLGHSGEVLLPPVHDGTVWPCRCAQHWPPQSMKRGVARA